MNYEIGDFSLKIVDIKGGVVVNVYTEVGISVVGKDFREGVIHLAASGDWIFFLSEDEEIN